MSLYAKKEKKKEILPSREIWSPLLTILEYNHGMRKNYL